MKKLLYLFWSMMLIIGYISPIKAEAGLSEVGRTIYYKYDDKLGFEVLPGGEGADGFDAISIVEFKENPKARGIDTSWCSSKYTLETDLCQVSFTNLPVYIYGDYLYAYSDNYMSGLIVNLNQTTIQSSLPDSQLNKSQLCIRSSVPLSKAVSKDDVEKMKRSFVLNNFTGKDSFEQTLKSLGIDKSKATRFDREYIQKNYQVLDIESIDGLSCDILNTIAVIFICLCLVLVVFIGFITVVILLIKRNNQRNQQLGRIVSIS